MSSQNNEAQANLMANQALQIIEAMGYPDVNTVYLSCGANPCIQKIDFDTNTKTYSLTGSAPEIIGTMPFERSIEIEQLPNPNAYKITSLVDWEDSSGIHHVSAKRIIY